MVKLFLVLTLFFFAYFSCQSNRSKIEITDLKWKSNKGMCKVNYNIINKSNILLNINYEILIFEKSNRVLNKVGQKELILSLYPFTSESKNENIKISNLSKPNKVQIIIKSINEI